MKIFLVQAYVGAGEQPVFPLGLSHVAAAAGGHRVALFDPNVARHPLDELSAAVRRFAPDLIGISIRNIDSTNKRRIVFYYPYIGKMLDVIGRSAPGHPKIVAGGPGFSMFARTIMEKEPRIDYGVCGEAEVTFPGLIAHLDAPGKIKNIFYRRNGNIVFSGAGEHPEPDAIHFKERYRFNLARYRGFPEAFGIETKRGCAFNCVYCPYGFLNGRHYRLRSPERVVDEIEYLAREKGIERFTFIDSVFNFPMEHAETICRQMVDRRLPVTWSAWFHDRFITPAFARLATRAGCRKFIFSPDGFSSEALCKLGKLQTPKDILTAYEVLKKIQQVEIAYNFFKNPPGQSLRAAVSMLRFALQAKIELTSRIHFELNSIRIEPDTRLRSIAIREGVVSMENDLLRPVKYTQESTRYIEVLFDLLLRMMGK